jgi:hypothetical protein
MCKCRELYSNVKFSRRRVLRFSATYFRVSRRCGEICWLNHRGRTARQTKGSRYVRFIVYLQDGSDMFLRNVELFPDKTVENWRPDLPNLLSLIFLLDLACHRATVLQTIEHRFLPNNPLRAHHTHGFPRTIAHGCFCLTTGLHPMALSRTTQHFCTGDFTLNISRTGRYASGEMLRYRSAGGCMLSLHDLWSCYSTQNSAVNVI